jgi:hypothetical protein
MFDDVSSDEESEAPSYPSSQDMDSTDITNHDLHESFDYSPMEANLDSEVFTNDVYRARHQVYAIITGYSGEGSEVFDSLGNPIINTDNRTQGGRYQAPPEEYQSDQDNGQNGQTQTVVRISWDRVKQAMHGGLPLLTDATREELMAYHYLICRQQKELLRVHQQLDERRRQAD